MFYSPMIWPVFLVSLYPSDIFVKFSYFFFFFFFAVVEIYWIYSTISLLMGTQFSPSFSHYKQYYWKWAYTCDLAYWCYYFLWFSSVSGISKSKDSIFFVSFLCQKIIAVYEVFFIWTSVDIVSLIGENGFSLSLCLVLS